MLTATDFDQIEKIVDEKIESKTKNLPTKEEFFNWMDKLMKELKGMREEHKILSGRVYEDHEPRIEKIEKKLQIQTA